MRNAQRGFTLIEIMVVVVILAVLGALVVPKILENVDKARVTRAQSDIRAIQTALDLYRLDNFKYPTTEQGLQALVKQPVDPTITNYRSGGYLGSLPKDPWNNTYQYVSPGPDGRDYDIITYGRDGKPGGDGYDADISVSTLEQKYSAAILSIGTTGRDSQLDEESRRIEGLVGLLHERALLEGRDFGLRIEPTAYEFVVYEPRQDRWMTFDQEHEFRRRDLPKGLSFQLELDARIVVIKPIDRNLANDAAPPAPQLAIAASGEGTPFRLTLLRDGTASKASVDGDALGKISRVSSDQHVSSDQSEKRT